MNRTWRSRVARFFQAVLFRTVFFQTTVGQTEAEIERRRRRLQRSAAARR